MVFEDAGGREAPSALRTREGLFSRVNAQVSVKVCFLRKTLFTLNAHERSLSGVDPYVFIKVSFMWETLSALRADEIIFAS